MICSWYDLRDNVKIETIRLRFSSLPSSFHGLRIVQISDLHASFWVNRAYLNRVVDQINAMTKDIVVITGDILTGSINSFLKHWLPDDNDTYLSMVIDVLSRLHDGAVKLAVLGNHDQGDGSENTRKLTYELDRIGFKVLRNESLTLTHDDELIYIAGTDDLWFSYDLPKTLADVPENAFKILLSHNPDITTEIRKKMQIDLTLCGHTHGGQVRIPFLTDYLMPISNPSRYMAGLVKEDYGYTYVNRGIGTLVFPLRLRASPEITSFHLT
ncbi:metallophosphoesterase [Desulfococcaceae bacterium HSG7]|nr:metallophosphoesterase [Desulfococcaceae bacterium HSG7]